MANARRKLIRRGNNESQMRGGGEMIKMHNIYPWWKMNFRLVFALLCLFLLGVEVPDQILAMI